MTTKGIRSGCLLALLLGLAVPMSAWGGPYAPAAGQEGSTAIDKADNRIVAWATEVTSIAYGAGVADVWKTPEKALGAAQGTSLDVVSLGEGGQIILSFAEAIRDGAGADFAVFENGYNDLFLELAFVEVSSNGIEFARFPNASLTPDSVEGFDPLGVDPTNVVGLAGKYRQGFGTPFDLGDLGRKANGVDLQNVRYVRLVDIVGDGTARDSDGRIIYDPYPTVVSTGFDLDAVGVLNEAVEGAETRSLSLREGWNLVSVPLQLLDTSVVATFGGTVNARAVWRWEVSLQRYAVAESIETLAGYWVYSSSAVTVTLYGFPVAVSAISLASGWNLVGPAAGTSVAEGVGDAAHAWHWNPATGAYEEVSQLVPLEAYWIRRLGE